MSNSISVRFLVFPKGKEFTHCLHIDDRWEDVQKSVFQLWPKDMDSLTSAEELRFIYSGRVVCLQSTVFDVLKDCSKDTIVTVHIVIKRNSSPISQLQDNTLTQTPNQNADSTNEEDLSDSFHFHGCFFNEEEVTEMKTIFEKKKGTDDKMCFSAVQQFLKVYWTWMKRNKYLEEQKQFPTEIVSSIKQKVVGDKDKVSLEQFLQLFFLFDCRTPEEICPHGEKLRVQRATAELHRCISEASFSEETFERIFRGVDRDSDGMLSCREMELFFYLYCVNFCCM